MHRNRKIVKITDAHVHFWNIEKISYPWLADVPAINKTFEVAQYNDALSGIEVENIIFVQCECSPDRYLDELHYIHHIARTDHRIKAIIPYFPLERPDAQDILRPLLDQYPLVKGIRRLEENATSLYSNILFLQNLDLLSQHDLTFDICVKAAQIHAAVQLVESKPQNKFVLDHFGKPNIKSKEFADWAQAIKRIASHSQVYCKLSGLVTEADWSTWDITELKPYFETVLEHFGVDRILFGSDWPVVTLAASYQKWYDTAIALCDGLDLQKIFYSNGLHIYSIASDGKEQYV